VPRLRPVAHQPAKHFFTFNSVYMDAPPPTKPPRGVKYGKDEVNYFKPSLKMLFQSQHSLLNQ